MEGSGATWGPGAGEGVQKQAGPWSSDTLLVAECALSWVVQAAFLMAIVPSGGGGGGSLQAFTSIPCFHPGAFQGSWAGLTCQLPCGLDWGLGVLG